MTSEWIERRFQPTHRADATPTAAATSRLRIIRAEEATSSIGGAS